MKKKTIIIIIIILILMLLPIKTHLKDGESIEYKAILYKYTKIHRLKEQLSTRYENGWELRIFGIYVYGKIDNSFIDNISGVWIADGTQMRVVISETEDGPIYKGNYSGPSYLTLYSNNSYYLETNNEYNTIESGYFEVGNAAITFYPDTYKYPDRMFWICDLKNNNKLLCNEYAETFNKK